MVTPVWPLALGRKGFAPSSHVFLPDGLVGEALVPALQTYDSEHHRRPHERMRLVLEHPSEGAIRLDQPVAPFVRRKFGPRFVVTHEFIAGAADAPDTASS